ncbi:MAG: fatty acid desaturase [Pseudomonadota bacterium]
MPDNVLRRTFVRRFMGLERYSALRGWLVVSVYVALILAAIYGGHLLLQQPLTLWSGLGVAGLMLFIGTRLRGINNIVHECSHASFVSDRAENTRIGRVCTAILAKSFKEYRDDHLSHHSHLGDYEHDEEFAVIEKFRLHEKLTAGMVLRLFVAPLLGRHLGAYTGISLSRADGPVYFWLRMSLLGLMIAVTAIAPLTGLLMVLMPWFFVYPTLNFWTDCIDHAGLVGSDDELMASRNVPVVAPLRLMFFPRNDCYHLVHHLFPQIPARHLKAAHEELAQDPVYAARHAPNNWAGWAEAPEAKGLDNRNYSS